MLRKLPPYLLLTSVTILLFSTLLHADTTWVAGEVWGTWTRDGNPYLVTDTLIVPLDSTLNIQPGVQIWFLDQEIRQTPIYVYGNLLAVGEEADSVYFLSPNAAFGSIITQQTPGTVIKMEYCVVDSINRSIASYAGLMILRHCRIHGHSTYLVSGTEEVDSIEYCQIYGGGAIFDHGGPSVFQHNEGGGIRASEQILAPIVDNQASYVWIDHCWCPDVYNNDLQWAWCTNTNSNWHDNRIDGYLNVSGGVVNFTHNMIGEVRVDESEAIFQENTINGGIQAEEGQIVFARNMVQAGSTGIRLFDVDSSLIQGNTITFLAYGIHATMIYSWMQLDVVNNIFLGTGESPTGIYNLLEHETSIRYNDFYHVSTITHNCELDTGNILVDPRFRAGDPYDYQLQANSPCIDTGDPASPLDPDGTRADMGCYFFDHRIDNPPAIISPVVVNIQRGTVLRYVARATDDNGPLQFGFWNLPSWLHQEDPSLDWMEDSSAVSGQVPLDQDNFSFGVWVEDGATQRDSQEISVLVSPYTILAGEVTGILTQDRSPYLVVEDLLVPEGDSLRIEPGVELIFQPRSGYGLSLIVNGKLTAVGTRTDSIALVSPGTWSGIKFLSPYPDTSVISHAILSNADHAVVTDSQAVLTIDHSSFQEPMYATVTYGRSSLSIDSSYFYGVPSMFLKCIGASVIVANSYFECHESVWNPAHFVFEDAADCNISHCSFVGGWGGKADFSSRLNFIGNRVFNTENGISFMNGTSGIAANNIFVGGEDEGIGVYGGDSILISNNVFFRVPSGVDLGSEAPSVSVQNNLFIGNQVGIETYHLYPPFTNISYNDFFDNDSDFVNCIPDSTNIFLDPVLQDTIDFRLSLGSPCIDAGDPDPFFNDVDSTRNDIGCWGGPWGGSYPYSPILSHQPKPIPTEFALLPPYPNPFNSVLVIPFTLPIEQEVTITVYNILGQKVQEFSFPPLPPGVHRVVWNSGSCASGIYIVRLISDGKEFNQKVVLLR